MEVGELLYYFGSRYSSKEFLYGSVYGRSLYVCIPPSLTSHPTFSEEIQAWLADGILTKAGLAFSRDTKKKVYIQHKMQEDGQLLADMLQDKDGVFYLCGPTWCVDQTNAYGFEHLIIKSFYFTGPFPTSMKP